MPPAHVRWLSSKKANVEVPPNGPFAQDNDWPMEEVDGVGEFAYVDHWPRGEKMIEKRAAAAVCTPVVDGHSAGGDKDGGAADGGEGAGDGEAACCWEGNLGSVRAYDSTSGRLHLMAGRGDPRRPILEVIQVDVETGTVVAHSGPLKGDTGVSESVLLQLSADPSTP